MRALKIAIVIHSMGSGGAERVSAHLANLWSVDGAEVHLITIAKSEYDFFSLHPTVRRHSLGLASNSKNLLWAIAANFLRICALRALFKTLKPDVVIAMMTGSAVLSLIASRNLDIRVIVSERTYPPNYHLGRIWEWLRQKTYPLAYRVVMQTGDGLTWLNQIIPSAHGLVIPNPVKYPLPVVEPFINPDDHIGSERMVALGVGRLDCEKQFDRLLTAFSMLSEKYRDWDLVILGEGSESRRLLDMIANLGLQGRVFMPGRVGNICDWYTRANLYVMSSRLEGFPNTLVEAMSYGCAAVSYDCDTGPRDIIRDQVDGLLVRPVGDSNALATTLNLIMGDDVLREEMGNEAIIVRERFSLQAIYCLWQAILENSPGIQVDSSG